MANAVQGRYQRTILVTTTAEPACGWRTPEGACDQAHIESSVPNPDKLTTPGVVHLPRPGPYVVKVVSGNCNIEVSFSSMQDILDDTATWEEWPHGAVVGPYDADVLAQGAALRITATVDAVVELMGI